MIFKSRDLPLSVRSNTEVRLGLISSRLIVLVVTEQTKRTYLVDSIM